MIIKKIKWTDPFTGEERERDFFFHVGMGDLSRVEMEYGFKGGMEGVAKAVVEARDAPAIVALFEKLVAMSYGLKTDDGDFVKKKEWTDQFVGGRAYDALFVELLKDSVVASEFFNGIMPPEVVNKVKQIQKEEAAKEGVQHTSPDIRQTPTFNLSPEAQQPIGKVSVTEHEGGLAMDVTYDKSAAEALETPTSEFDPFRKPLSEYTYVELTELPYKDFDRLMRTHKGQLPKAVQNLRFQRDLQNEQ